MEMGSLSRSVEKNGSTVIQEIWYCKEQDRVSIGDRPDKEGWEKIGWVESNG